MKKKLKNERKLSKKEKGITLIALVITIVILLILAGISISMVTGNNGILKNTTSTVKNAKIVSAQEKIEREIDSSFTDEEDLDLDLLNENFQNHLEGLLYKGKPINTDKTNSEEYNVITSFMAIVNFEGYNYKILSDGTVLNINENAITIDDIKNNEESYYGKYITNYNSAYDEGIADADNQLGKWQIFLVDDDNIYLIASNYISRYYTKEKDDVGFLYDTSKTNLKEVYQMGFVDYRNYNLYSTKGDVANVLLRFDEKTRLRYHEWLNKKMFYMPNSCANAALIDVDLWDGYINYDYADYAIGAPTLEMFCESYNSTHSGDKIQPTLSTYGYRVKLGNNSATDELSNINKNLPVDVMFFGKNYWLASTSNKSNGWSSLYILKSNGLYTSDHRNSTQYGMRPVVCLKSSTTLVEHDNNGVKTYTLEK